MKEILTHSVRFIIGVISLTAFIYLINANDYTVNKLRSCEVLEKYERDFILILKEERGIIFDFYATPTIYSQSNKGEIIQLNISDSYIKNDRIGELRIGFIIFLGVFTIVFLITGSCDLFIKIKELYLRRN